jgi:hypothetical protein
LPILQYSSFFCSSFFSPNFLLFFFCCWREATLDSEQMKFLVGAFQDAFYCFM